VEHISCVISALPRCCWTPRHNDCTVLSRELYTCNAKLRHWRRFEWLYLSVKMALEKRCSFCFDGVIWTI
jgi:hypothetical protein